MLEGWSTPSRFTMLKSVPGQSALNAVLSYCTVTSCPAVVVSVSWSDVARFTNVAPARIDSSAGMLREELVLLVPHVVPSGAAGFEQAPVPGLHVPATWHWSLAVQVTGLLPVHVPLWQVSVWVHALPSLH